MKVKKKSSILPTGNKKGKSRTGVQDATGSGNDVVTFSYALYNDDVLKSLRVLGDIDPITQVLYGGEDYNNTYYLVISARALNDYDLQTFDITIDFDTIIFEDILASDIQIGNNFPVANSAKIDNTNGTIRIAGASCGALNLGESIAQGSEGIIAFIALNFVEISPEESLSNHSPLTFSITANREETVFSKALDDGTGMNNRTIHSLNETGRQIEVTGSDVTLNHNLDTVDYTYSVQNGWNIIPICYDNIVTVTTNNSDDKTGILSAFYGYNGTYYQVNDNELVKGGNYWVKVDRNIDTIYFHLT